MTNRTNEQLPPILELRSPAATRLAALFLHHRILTLRELYRILDTSTATPDFSRSSLRGVLTRWKNRNILLFDGRRYILNPRGGREILLNALGGGSEPVREQGALDQPTRGDEPVRTERVLVDITPRWWAEVFDLPAAWMENTRIYTRVDENIAKGIWTLCERKPKGPKDRSQKARHYDKAFTLVVFPRGKLHIFTRESPDWLDRLGKWLKDGGLGPSDLRLVASAIQNKLGRAIGTLEIPLKVSTEPVQQFEAHIKTANREAHIRLVHSHFDIGEIEARGDLQYRLDWLAMLTGVSMEVMNRSEELEQLKTERTELRDRLDNLQKQISDFAERFKKQDETLKEIEKERERVELEKQKKRDLDYIG